MEENKSHTMNKNVKKIYYLIGEGHYGLQILFELTDQYVYFDSSRFLVKEKSEIDVTTKWRILEYIGLESDIFIEEIKEDENTSYFIKFSNNDILYIYQFVDGMENWVLDFEIVTINEISKYNELIKYMNEDWVENIELIK